MYQRRDQLSPDELRVGGRDGLSQSATLYRPRHLHNFASFLSCRLPWPTTDSGMLEARRMRAVARPVDANKVNIPDVIADRSHDELAAREPSVSSHLKAERATAQHDSIDVRRPRGSGHIFDNEPMLAQCDDHRRE